MTTTLLIDPETGLVYRPEDLNVTEQYLSSLGSRVVPIFGFNGSVKTFIKKNGFSVASLFAGGKNGAWIKYYDPTTLNTARDGSGTDPTATDPIGRGADASGNGNDAIAINNPGRGTFQTGPNRIVLDAVDDNMAIDFGAAFTGTVLQGTPNGVIHMEINVPSGAWELTVSESFVPDGGAITELIAVEGTPNSADAAATKTYLQDNGAGADFVGVTSMASWFRNRSDITELHTSGWNTSDVTIFQNFIYTCSNLIAIDVQNWNTSKVANFQNFAFNALSLETLDLSNWNTSSATIFAGFVRGCSSLTTVTVNGGSGSPFSDSPCTDYTLAFTGTNLTQQSIDDILVAIESAGTSSGTFDQSGGSAPSAMGQAAVTALRGRGWTVTVTGGF